MSIRIERCTRFIARLLPALLIGCCLGTASPVCAGEGDRDDHRWTVLTLAHDGAWGTATDAQSGRAIASAISNCKAMSKQSSCGSKFVTTRNGWSVAVLCGDEPIIATARQYADAERIAIEHETELRQVYRRDLARCVRVATVGPDGAITTPYAQAAGRR